MYKVSLFGRFVLFLAYIVVLFFIGFVYIEEVYSCSSVTNHGSSGPEGSSCEDYENCSGKCGKYTYKCGGLCYDESCGAAACGGGGSCEDKGCTPAACSVGTGEDKETPYSLLRPVGVFDYYSTNTCTTNCGKTHSRDCYCDICLPASCASFGYSPTDLGQGFVPDSSSPSCRNGSDLTPNGNQLCSLTYRNCYCYSCFKQCPAPLTNTGNANLILSNFKACTNDCGVILPDNQNDCYEPESPQPTESLVIDGSAATPNDFGFLSLTHTGDNRGVQKQGDSNDPFLPVKMIATYTDVNGSSDIEGLFVWFRGSGYTGELNTPVYISDSAVPKASSNDSWGFMLRRVGSVWQPYVPSYDGGNTYWRRVSKEVVGSNVIPSGNSDEFQGSAPPLNYEYKFTISDHNNGLQMVEVTMLGNPVESGNTVSITFSLRFSNNNGDLFPGRVSEGMYKIYLMGLDKFSFTPYDNYDIDYENFWSKGFLYDDFGTGQEFPPLEPRDGLSIIPVRPSIEDFSPFWQPNRLRYKPEQNQFYARDWTDTGKTWTIDRTSPEIETFAFGVPDENKLEVHWSVSDDRSLYSVVGNIYISPELPAKQIELFTDDLHTSLRNPNSFIPRSVNLDYIGQLNGDWSFKVNPNMDSSSNEGTLYIDVGENTSGLFEIYLTVFDDAGNISSEDININIADWFATGGGVVYSAGGSEFSTKSVSVHGSESLDLPYPSTNPGLLLDRADISSEMWAEGLNKDPLLLVKSTANTKSYNITKYPGYKLTNGYYDFLKKEYTMNKKNIKNLEEVFPDSSILLGSLNSICGGNMYCMFDYTGNLNVKDGIICDNKSVIFVAGDLTIDTPIKNMVDNTLSNKNGCIFIVKGNVIIKKGANMSSTKLGYDVVHGYILADGRITIEDERPKSGIIDGVYINGGLSSSYREDVSIIVNRYLRVEERLSYPVLVIDYHPKYGVIAEKLFGRRISIKPVELGVKPY